MLTSEARALVTEIQDRWLTFMCSRTRHGGTRSGPSAWAASRNW